MHFLVPVQSVENYLWHSSLILQKPRAEMELHYCFGFSSWSLVLLGIVFHLCSDSNPEQACRGERLFLGMRRACACLRCILPGA